jgi:methylglutaconyl-CoA hydratase
MNEKSVLCDFYSHIARIRLNRPKQGNVVNEDNLSLLFQYIEEANRREDCRAIVIEGSGGVFCRGLDFTNLLKHADKEIDIAFSEPYVRAVMAIRNSARPVIAAVDGDVLAGGTGLAFASDILLATRRSVFGLSEVIFGLIPAYVFPFLLERVAFKKARSIVLSSKKFTAEEFYRIGIVDDLAEDDKLEKMLTGYLKRLLCSAPSALALTKSYSDRILHQDIREALKTAAMQLTSLLNNKENIKAIRGFMEGEPIEWMVKYKRK